MALDPLGAAFELGNTIINKIWKDPQQQADAQFRLSELYQKGDLAELQAHVSLLSSQLKVNEAEAGHTSIFVAGWRPAIGWVCALALAYNYILFPFLNVVNVYMDTGLPLPSMKMDDLFELVLGMLGLASLRTYEKRRGVSK